MTPATLMVMRHCFWNLSSTTSWGGTTMLRGKLAAALAAAFAALAIIIIIIAINICLFSAVHSKEPLEEKSQYTFIRTNSLLTVIAATTLTSVLSRCPGAGAGGWGVEFIVFIGRLSELQRAAPWVEQRAGHHTQSLYRLRNQLLITNNQHASYILYLKATEKMFYFLCLYFI